MVDAEARSIIDEFCSPDNFLYVRKMVRDAKDVIRHLLVTFLDGAESSMLVQLLQW